MKLDFDETIGGTFAMAVPEGERVSVSDDAGRSLTGAEAAVALLSRRHDPSDPAAMRKFNPSEPRIPGGPHGGEWGSGGALHKAVKALTGDDALNAPPMDLAKLTAAGDHRADALWYRTGDNSLDTLSGEPGFIALNKHLRNYGYSEEMDKRVADIDSVMRESKLKEPVTVIRGIDPHALGSPGNLKGAEFTDQAYASTTTDEAHAKNFGTIMRITVPAGTGAIRMADRDPGEPESEILLDRDLKYRVTAERLERDDRGRLKSHELDVEVVPG